MTLNKRGRIAVVGATGQFGYPLTLKPCPPKALMYWLSPGHLQPRNEQKLENPEECRLRAWFLLRPIR